MHSRWKWAVRILLLSVSLIAIIATSYRSQVSSPTHRYRVTIPTGQRSVMVLLRASLSAPMARGRIPHVNSDLHLRWTGGSLFARLLRRDPDGTLDLLRAASATGTSTLVLRHETQPLRLNPRQECDLLLQIDRSEGLERPLDVDFTAHTLYSWMNTDVPRGMTASLTLVPAAQLR